MRRKKRKGFSLVEVLVSVLLIGLMATVVLNNMVTCYQLLVRTKKVTEDMFQATYKFEKEIDTYRKEIKAGGGSLTEKKVSLTNATTSIEVAYYPIIHKMDTDSNTSLLTVLSEGVLPLAVPEYLDMKIAFNNGQAKDATYLTAGLTAGIEPGTVILDENGVYLMTSYQWYVSEKGYNTRRDFSDSGFSGTEVLYPKYPEDYSIVKNEKGERISEKALKNLAGRHVVLVATPVADSGKMGYPFVTESLYISGIPIHDDRLSMHFDAGLVDNTDLREDLNTNDKYYLTKWINFKEESMSAQQLNDSQQPGVSTAAYGERWGNAVNFENGHMMTANLNGGSFNNISVFAVASSTTNTGTIIRGSAWELGLDGFAAGGQNVSAPAEAGRWNMLEGSVQDGKIEFYYNNNLSATIPGAFGSGGGTVQIGDGTQVSIAEIIIYTDALSDTERQEVREYLMEKYTIED